MIFYYGNNNNRKKNILFCVTVVVVVVVVLLLTISMTENFVIHQNKISKQNYEHFNQVIYDEKDLLKKQENSVINI